MLEEYIKEIVKKELAKQKLNCIYGKNKHELKQENEKLKENIKWLQNDKDVLLKQVSQQYEEYEKLEQQNEKLKQENEDVNLELETIMNTVEILGKENEQLKEKTKWFQNDKDVLLKQISEQNEEILKLKQENEQLKNLSCTIVIDNDGKLDSLFNKQLRKENEQLKESIENLEGKLILKGNLLSEQKQENEKLKKELLDSKNGLNGANHVIKNNKEWINSQDKKIKELEEEIRCLKSDNEDLQYNLRRKTTQKIQLETKNKCSEEKLTKISNVISLYNTNEITFMSLMSTINNIKIVLKES